MLAGLPVFAEDDEDGVVLRAGWGRGRAGECVAGGGAGT